MRPTRSRAGGWLGAAAVAGCGAMCAAQQSAGAADDKVPTLHAYTNLVQIPTLVLDQGRRPMAPIAERKFFVSVDGGPRLRVTHARLEADDPISLAILLDVTQTDPRIMERIDDAIAGLAPASLHAMDVVTIYALDCRLVRSAGMAAKDGASLKHGVDLALETWTARGRRRAKGGCEKPWHLWDSMAAMTRAVGDQGGRRVILAVTDGVDRGSRSTWNGVRDFAQSRGIAIFGLVQPGDVNSGYVMGMHGQNQFNSLCELTGGIMLTADAKELPKQLAWFVTLVRSRYIVEFPHPLATESGFHVMDITVERMDAFIRAAGVSIPLDDPAILNDPNSILPDPSHAPQLGKKKVTPE